MVYQYFLRSYRETLKGSANTQYYRRKAGQFVYSKLDFLNQAFGIIPEHLDGYESTVDLPCFDTSKELDTRFLLEYVQRRDYYKKYGEIADGGRKAKRIQVETFLDFPIFLPKLNEQKKLSACLSSIDDLITNQSQKLATLKDHKKGLMQQLFPAEGESVPKLRFPEFQNSGDWKLHKIENLAKRGSGHTPNKSISENYNGGVKWVSLADSKNLDNGFIFNTTVEISEEGIKNSSAVLHPQGTVILSRDAGVGKSAVLNSAMAVSQHFIAWQCDEKKLSNWFLYYTLQALKPAFERIAVGNTIKTIGLPYFKELKINKPSFEEQEKIAECLRSVDDLISIQLKKVENIKLHKKSLMQKLFPSLRA
ncbi:restriction endonuclease subunit S [Endozoicomonas sp. ONNA2]|uniref:restriction endonuclease subunit S n=1 Tax=Endozoicomonas sp. ONNA2 TaxID=2828741 RepID=UPI002148DACD|nr:restriction endonuclease subunit S [Endozoicomonas sp. ONNA2]